MHAAPCALSWRLLLRRSSARIFGLIIGLPGAAASHLLIFAIHKRSASPPFVHPGGALAWQSRHPAVVWAFLGLSFSETFRLRSGAFYLYFLFWPRGHLHLDGTLECCG